LNVVEYFGAKSMGLYRGKILCHQRFEGLNIFVSDLFVFIAEIYLI